MSTAPVLIIPAGAKGRGGGHLSRSMFLLRKLVEAGREAYIWIDESLKEDVLERYGELLDIKHSGAIYPADASRACSGTGAKFPRFISGRKELFEHDWDFVILDNFRTSAREFDFWSSLPGSVPLIGIDEGGPCRDRFDFLIDLLPGVSGHEPNLSAPRLLPLPKNRRQAASGMLDDTGFSSAPRRILISFGAEDAAGLGRHVARTLASYSSFSEITLVTPKNGETDEKDLPGLHVIGTLPDLKEHLAEYDLFITHFGLAAFEAVYARVPVLLVSPTVYHEKLARNAGFLTINPGKKINSGNNRKKTQAGQMIKAAHLFEALKIKREEIARRYGLEEDQKEDLAVYINSLVLHSPANCPACGEKAGFKALARFAELTYCLCPACGIIYLSRLSAPKVNYNGEYFFDSYKKQYGKTYLEDFPNLKETGRRRMAVIKSLHMAEAQRAQVRQYTKNSWVNKLLQLLNIPAPCPKSAVSNPGLLDIGCAYGPFLTAAAEAGFAPEGIEPIEDAARYVREELGFPCRQGFFREGNRDSPALYEEGSFDAVTLWFVLEHFRDPGKALREIHGLLKEGGALAFSTPSCSGISGRKSLHAFLKSSPEDHWTVWSPGVCRRILKQYGFRLRKIVVTGHHPERFPFLGRFIQPDKKGGLGSLLFHLLLFISRLFGLGDTFEAYGIKIANRK